jgi:hypothetical protein
MINIKKYTDHLMESYDDSEIEFGFIKPERKVTELTKDQEEYKNLIINKLERKLDGERIEGWTFVPASPSGYTTESPSFTTFNAGINVPSAADGDDIIIFGPFFDDKDWFVTCVATFEYDGNRDIQSTDFCAYDIWQHMTGDAEEDSEFIIDMIKDIMPRLVSRINKQIRSKKIFGRR